MVIDELVEHLAHRSRIAAHDGVGGGNVTVGIEALPVEPVPGLGGELLEEDALGPAIALAKRVDRVDFAQVVRQAVDESIPRKAPQDALVAQLP